MEIEKIILNFLEETIKKHSSHNSFASLEKWFSIKINSWLSGSKYNKLLKESIDFLCKNLNLNNDLPEIFYYHKNRNNLEEISIILAKKLSDSVSKEELLKCCQNFIQIKLIEKAGNQ
jgi:hypothetical protein